MIKYDDEKVVKCINAILYKTNMDELEGIDAINLLNCYLSTIETKNKKYTEHDAAKLFTLQQYIDWFKVIVTVCRKNERFNLVSLWDSQGRSIKQYFKYN